MKKFCELKPALQRAIDHWIQVDNSDAKKTKGYPVSDYRLGSVFNHLREEYTRDANNDPKLRKKIENTYIDHLVAEARAGKASGATVPFRPPEKECGPSR
jgi:hypothetical protein